MLSRRGLLAGLLGVAAPAIVPIKSLMAMPRAPLTFGPFADPTGELSMLLYSTEDQGQKPRFGLSKHLQEQLLEWCLGGERPMRVPCTVQSIGSDLQLISKPVQALQRVSRVVIERDGQELVTVGIRWGERILAPGDSLAVSLKLE